MMKKYRMAADRRPALFKRERSARGDSIDIGASADGLDDRLQILDLSLDRIR